MVDDGPHERPRSDSRYVDLAFVCLDQNFKPNWRVTYEVDKHGRGDSRIGGGVSHWREVSH